MFTKHVSFVVEFTQLSILTRVHNAGSAPDVLRVGLDLGPLVDGAARVLGVHAARGREDEAADIALRSLPDFDGVEDIFWVIVIP